MQLGTRFNQQDKRPMRGFVVQDLLTIQSWRGTGIEFQADMIDWLSNAIEDMRFATTNDEIEACGAALEQ
jgi:hypothetical protein